MTAVVRPGAQSARGPERIRRPLSRSHLRCSAALAEADGDGGRCQLLAGHAGPHALMFLCADLRRTVRSWSTTAPQQWVDSHTAFQRPWALGFPAPAWGSPA